MNNYLFEYKKGKFIGLLDNAIGMLVCNSLLLEEWNVCALEKMGKVGLFFGDSEEWGTIGELPKLKKEDTVVVVDVASGTHYKGLDFTLENIHGFKPDKITDIKESLEWEGFKLRAKVWDGNPDDEDEAWKWRELGHKAISFIIPVENGSKDTGWHVPDCTITVEKVVRAKQGLKRLINYLL
jgi:hypothetical protein